MSLSRRSIFGLFAAAPAAVGAVKASEAPSRKPEFFIGQIRAVHSHYETKIVASYHSWPSSDQSSGHTHTFSQMVPTTEAVAVVRYEQWDGEKWLPIGEPLA